jgi:hypothetical protein
MKFFPYALVLATSVVTVPALATVIVSSPSNGESVNSNVQFIASANTTTCSKGVASMGIYVDNSLKYEVSGISFNTSLSLSAGNHKAVIEEWDYCGGATTATIDLVVNNQVGVVVTSPVNGSTVSSPAAFVATATTGCAAGVAATGVYVNNQLIYKTGGNKLNTQLSLATGTQNAVVQEWDNCGGAAKTPVTVKVSGGSSSGGGSSGGGSSSSSAGSSIPSLQANPDWRVWGELPPSDSICSPCKGLSWSLKQHDSSVSLDGNATRFDIGGTRGYADVLFYNDIIGDGNTTNLKDSDHKLLPTLHNFTLDTYVFVSDLAVTQSLEIDINMYLNSVGMEWGTQCAHLGDGTWDIWNNETDHWFSTGVPCKLNNGAWNHVTIQVQRESNNDLLYRSISVNGVTHTINKEVAPFRVPGEWWGMTVNFQMDGNYRMSANTTYMDKTTFTYW